MLIKSLELSSGLLEGLTVPQRHSGPERAGELGIIEGVLNYAIGQDWHPLYQHRMPVFLLRMENEDSTAVMAEAGPTWMKKVAGEVLSSSRFRFGTRSYRSGTTRRLGQSYIPKWERVFTIQAWVYLDSLPVSSGYDATIFAHDEVYPSPNRGPTLSVYWNPQTSIRGLMLFLPNDKGSITLLDGVNFPTGVWVHVAAASDGETVRLFKNGAIVNSASIHPEAVIANPPTSYWIGARTEPAPTALNGYIDEVVFYNDACLYDTAFPKPDEAFDPLKANIVALA